MGEAARARELGDWCDELCFAHPAAFLIPAEQWSKSGLRREFADLLVENRDLAEGWVGLFNQAVAIYFERVSELARAAPRYWRRPRLANLCIVQEPERACPYTLPFSRTSLLLYESDFDPAVSNVEHAAYQLVHAERLSRIGDMGMSWVHDLSYFLPRSAAEREAFAAGCRTSTRPDAQAFAALAGLMPSLDAIHHDDLRPCPDETSAPTVRVEFAGLTVPAGQQEEFQRVGKTFLAVAHGVMQRHYDAQTQSGGDGADQALVEWLAETKRLRIISAERSGIRSATTSSMPSAPWSTASRSEQPTA